MAGKRIKVRESDIQKAILEWLQLSGYTAWRNYVGPIMRAGVPCPNYNAGQPDIFGLFKAKRGRMFAIEVKTVTGRVAAEQVDWLHRLNKAGCCAFIARDLATVIDTIRREDQ